MCLFIMSPLMSQLIHFSLQIILRATILTKNATVAVDDISITEECGVVNKSLLGVSQESEGKFCAFQHIFPNICYV